MAKSAAASDVGRLQKTNKPSLPLRRSARIIRQAPFRFADLPPDLRDWILALAIGENEPLRLIACLSGTAKALSQVSRAIRVDAARMFFAGHTVHVIIGYRPESQTFTHDAFRVNAWARTWGLLASTDIRSLRLLCHRFQFCTPQISVDAKDHADPVVFGRHYSRFLFRKQGEQGPTAEQLSLFINDLRGTVDEQTEEQRASRVAGMLSRAGLKLT